MSSNKKQLHSLKSVDVRMKGSFDIKKFSELQIAGNQ